MAKNDVILFSTKYFNFPIGLLKNYLQRPQEAIAKIVHYSLYSWLDKKYPNEQFFEDEIEEAKNYFNCSYFNIKFGKNIFYQCKENENKLEFRTFASIKTETALKFLSNNIDEFQHVQFLAYVAIRSFVNSKKPIYKINNKLLYARMSGETTFDAVFDMKILQYYNRYQTEKLRSFLSEYWGVNFYSTPQMRGYYVSIDLQKNQIKNFVEHNFGTTKNLINKMLH